MLLVGRSQDKFLVVSLGIFSVVPPTEPCALRSTQPLKVSTRDLSWGKGGRCVWLTNYHPCSAETSRKSGALPTRNPLGHLGQSRETFTFFLYNKILNRRNKKSIVTLQCYYPRASEWYKRLLTMSHNTLNARSTIGRICAHALNMAGKSLCR